MLLVLTQVVVDAQVGTSEGGALMSKQPCHADGVTVSRIRARSSIAPRYTFTCEATSTLSIELMSATGRKRKTLCLSLDVDSRPLCVLDSRSFQWIIQPVDLAKSEAPMQPARADAASSGRSRRPIWGPFVARLAASRAIAARC